MTLTPNSSCPVDDPPRQIAAKMSQTQWQRRFRYLYLRFIRLQGSPEQLARGMASGVFSGCFPLFGLQMIIGIAVATALRGNRIMAAASTWISNPFTYLPLFAFNYQVGAWLLGGGAMMDFSDLEGLKGWMDMGTEVSVRLMLGSTVVGLVLALLSYQLGLPLIRRIRHRRQALTRFR